MDKRLLKNSFMKTSLDLEIAMIFIPYISENISNYI